MLPGNQLLAGTLPDIVMIKIEMYLLGAVYSSRKGAGEGVGGEVLWLSYENEPLEPYREGQTSSKLGNYRCNRLV